MAKKSYYIYLGGLGFSLITEMTVAAILGFFLGNYFDNKYQTAPFLAVLGLLLFSLVAFYHIYRVLDRLSKRMDASNEDDGGS